jgi:SHS2 domain-containing protein
VKSGFELTEHTADVGIHAFGPTREVVFEQAALAMASLICDPATVRPRDDVPVVLTADNDELLLVSWLNELLFLTETRRLVWAAFGVREVEGGRLWARARGEKQDPKRHEVRAQVKAATYHGLELQRSDGCWEARVVLDV